EADCRHLGSAELTTAQNPTVSGDHVVIAISHDWNDEAEGLNAVRELSDLFAAVLTRIVGIEAQFVDAAIDNVEAEIRRANGSGQSFGVVHGMLRLLTGENSRLGTIDDPVRAGTGRRGPWFALGAVTSAVLAQLP